MKKAILMMTFGSPEEITFEGVADFFTNIRRGVRPQTTRFRLSMIIMYELEARLCKKLPVKRLPW
ncbi:ferrochelatase [Streptococcus pneumoniae]|nr:ferrochelatase [Streptococcus pneumoniae]